MVCFKTIWITNYNLPKDETRGIIETKTTMKLARDRGFAEIDTNKYGPNRCGMAYKKLSNLEGDPIICTSMDAPPEDESSVTDKHTRYYNSWVAVYNISYWSQNVSCSQKERRPQIPCEKCRKGERVRTLCTRYSPSLKMKLGIARGRGRAWTSPRKGKRWRRREQSECNQYCAV